jgi:glutathionylspermidine synthase
LEHVANGKVKLINPPGSFLCQAKSTMAAIWALHEERHPLFSKEEHEIIEKHFLPTYVEPTPLRGSWYVQKPLWGREGGGVSIIGSGGKVVAEARTPYYFEQPRLYQKYLEMPKVTVKTWEGDYEWSLLVGSFLIGGQPAGVFLRIGSMITGNLSTFLPVTVEK